MKNNALQIVLLLIVTIVLSVLLYLVNDKTNEKGTIVKILLPLQFEN